MHDPHIAGAPVPCTVDPRDMLRRYLIARSLDAMQASADRRREALATGHIAAYRRTIRDAVRGFYGELSVGPGASPVRAIPVSQYDKDGYRLENVLFDSFPGWQVNATVYVPLDAAPPFPAVVIPVGHSGKQFADYQLPAQLFARCGYLAVLFDPPGQSSEKQTGNDHFRDGVRCYPVGQTSSRYFIADALRCIDYLETRDDVDLSRGIAMTGVSGGGTTTTFATLLDDRITVAGPSCCLSPLAQLDIVQCYAGCPETHMFSRYAEGIDEVDLLCAAAPIPLLLMGGAHDEVFHIEDTRRLADEVRQFYIAALAAAAGTAEHFRFFEDQSGHAYTLTQAREFVRFLNRWLLEDPEQPLPDLPDESFVLDPYTEIQCHPRQDVNMHTLSLDRADELAAARNRDADHIRAAARDLIGMSEPPAAPQVSLGEPFRIWTHMWQQALLQPEPGIELPATFLTPLDGPSAAVLHLDDQHRNRLLYRHGPLARAAHFLEKDALGHAVLAVDLRGWGDTTPAMYPYETVSWGGIDRYLAYTSAALGDPVLAMRVRDALASLAYLRTRTEVDPDRVVVTGCGLAGVVALHLAALDDRLAGAVIWDAPVSFKSLLAETDVSWPADAFFPDVLLHYDLPDLVTACHCPVRVLNPLDGAGVTPRDTVVAELSAGSGRGVYAAESADLELVRTIRSMVEITDTWGMQQLHALRRLPPTAT